MEQPIKEILCKGNVIFAPFPYVEELEKYKVRPVLVIKVYNQNLSILMITSQTGREHEIPLEKRDFCAGCLDKSPSYIRYDMAGTIHKNIVKNKIGKIKDDKLDEVIKKYISFIKEPVIEESKSKAFARAKKHSSI